MSNIKIYDNFLSPVEFQNLSDNVMAKDFPWFYGEVLGPADNQVKQKYNIQMIHMFYQHLSITSPTFSLLDPLIRKLGVMVLLRVKCNTTFASDTIHEHGMHVDVHPSSLAKLCTTAIYYFNDNNGYTLFEDGTLVESVANRLVTFPTIVQHTGTSCTDEARRVVLNLNYIGDLDEIQGTDS